MPAPTAALSYNAHLWKTNGIPAGSTSFDQSCVSDPFELELTIDLSGDHASGDAFEIDGSEVFVSLAPFIEEGAFWYPRGTSPRSGWFLQIPTGLSPGNTIDARAVNLADLDESLEPSSPANTIVRFTYVNATTLALEIRLRPGQDLEEFVRQKRIRHSEWWRKTTLRSDLDENKRDSVYNEEKALGVHVQVTKQGERIRFEKHFPLRLRWWNQDENGDPWPYDFEVKIERDEGAGLQEFNSLSSFVDNLITWRIQKPGPTLQQGVTTLMIWEQGNENKALWHEDINLSEATLLTSALPAELDNMIWSPATNWSLSGGYYEGSFTIPANLVEPGKTYRFGARMNVITDPGAVYQYTQPLLWSTTTDDGGGTGGGTGGGGIEPPCDFAIIGLVKDYDKQYNTTEISKATPADRYRICAKIDKTPYETCAGPGSFWDDIGSYTLKVYEDGDPLNPIYMKTVFKDPDTGNSFPQAKNFSYLEDATNFMVCFDFRAMFLNDQGLEDFADRDIVFEWQFKFDYFGAPSWSTIYLYKFLFHFEDYDNFRTSPEREILAINYYDADTGLPLGGTCGTDRILVEIVLDAGHGSDGTNIHVRGFVDRSPYGCTLISDLALAERDGYVSTQSFEQLEEDPIEYIDEFFDANGVARMIIDCNLIEDSLERRVLAIQQSGI